MPEESSFLQKSFSRQLPIDRRQSPWKPFVGRGDRTPGGDQSEVFTMCSGVWLGSCKQAGGRLAPEEDTGPQQQQTPGGRKQEPGGRRQEPGGRGQEAGARRQEPGEEGKSQETGGKSQEAGDKSQEARGKSQEAGTRSKEQEDRRQ